MPKESTAKVINIEEKQMDDGFLGALEKTKVEKPKKAKSKGSASVEAPAEVKEAIDDFNTAKAEKKKAEAKMKKHSPVIINYVKDIQDKDGFDGEYHKSYDVEGNETKVKFVTSNRFSIKNEDEHLIQDILGDKFSLLIKKIFTVTLKPEVMKDRNLQKELMERMGDRFADFFESVPSLVPVDDFDKRIYEEVDEDELNDLRTFVKQASPSLR